MYFALIISCIRYCIYDCVVWLNLKKLSVKLFNKPVTLLSNVWWINTPFWCDNILFLGFSFDNKRLQGIMIVPKRQHWYDFPIQNSFWDTLSEQNVKKICLITVVELVNCCRTVVKNKLTQNNQNILKWKANFSGYTIYKADKF